MKMNGVRFGQGKPLLLIHGLGGSWRSWTPVLDALGAEREVIAVDLPGFGETPPLSGPVTIGTLADAVIEFLDERDLRGVDMAGSSMGARLVLELARRGAAGATVSLDPGGFWSSWQQPYFTATIGLSIGLVRLLQPYMPQIVASEIGRTLLFWQVSAHPWDLPPAIMLDEMRSWAQAKSFDELLKSLVSGPRQQGIASGAMKKPIVIGWGRHDRVCFPGQAVLATRLFPDARLHWFEHSGHFPQWDSPRETVQLILDSTR